MNINTKGTNIELTQAIDEYVSRRLENVKRFIADDTTAQCDVELKKTTQHHKHGEIFRAEIHIIGKNRNVYAAAEKSDLYSAIDSVRDEIFRQLTNSKDKKVSLIRKSGARVKNALKGLFGRNSI